MVIGRCEYRWVFDLLAPGHGVWHWQSGDHAVCFPCATEMFLTAALRRGIDVTNHRYKRSHRNLVGLARRRTERRCPGADQGRKHADAFFFRSPSDEQSKAEPGVLVEQSRFASSNEDQKEASCIAVCSERGRYLHACIGSCAFALVVVCSCRHLLAV